MLSLWLVGAANAAGFHYLKVGGLYGIAESSPPEDNPLEAGFEVSLFNDGLAYWMTFGDPSADGHRVKEWWIESHHYGPQLGSEPDALADDEPEARRLPLWLDDVGWFRVGTDHTTRRNFEIDGSRHLMLTVPGFWGVETEQAHFGPTLGIGWNLTWWENWKDRSDYVVNTGKVTAEGGWVAGLFLWDTVFAQGRVTGHYDLFGIHQTQLKVAAITGVYLDRVGVPLGLEIKGELDRGNDTVTTQFLEWWAVRLALVYRAVPKDEMEVQEILDALEAMEGDDALDTPLETTNDPPAGEPPATEPPATEPPATEPGEAGETPADPVEEPVEIPRATPAVDDDPTPATEEPPAPPAGESDDESKSESDDEPDRGPRGAGPEGP